MCWWWAETSRCRSRSRSCLLSHNSGHRVLSYIPSIAQWTKGRVLKKIQKSVEFSTPGFKILKSSKELFWKLSLYCCNYTEILFSFYHVIPWQDAATHLVITRITPPVYTGLRQAVNQWDLSQLSLARRDLRLVYWFYTVTKCSLLHFICDSPYYGDGDMVCWLSPLFAAVTVSKIKFKYQSERSRTK